MREESVHRIHAILGMLEAWKKKSGKKMSYSFTVGTCGLSSYKLSLYEYGEHGEALSAYSIATNDLKEIVYKIQKGLKNAHN